MSNGNAFQSFPIVLSTKSSSEVIELLADGKKLGEKDQQEYLQRQVREMEQQLRQKDEQEENLQGQLREMEQQLSKKDEQEENLQRQMREMDRQHREKDEQEHNLQGQLRELEQQLSEKDQQEENLQRQVREMEHQLREKDEQEENLQGQVREILREMAQQQSEKAQQEENFQRQLRELEQQLREKDELNDNLQRHLTEMEQQLREKEDQKDNLQRHLREMEEQLTSLQDQYRQKEDKTVNLQRQVTTQQRQLWVKGRQVNELEITLSTAQQALSEHQRRKVTPDWVISRDKIQLTDKLLGRGGWGSVVEGKYCGCSVAVKQIYELILSPHNRSLFEREMDIASKCRHPCLLQFIGATNDEGSPLFLTELMESSLRALLEQRPLSATEVSIISLDVARALNYLHQKTPSPIIHRDISSANVLLWRQGDQWRGKVSDYGTANVMKHTMTVGPGATIYMAPEALTSRQTVKVSYDLLKVC